MGILLLLKSKESIERTRYMTESEQIITICNGIKIFIDYDYDSEYFQCRDYDDGLGDGEIY